MTIHTDLSIYKSAYDLLSLAADVSRNMPKDFKQTLGRRIHDECIEMLVLIARANATLVGNARISYLTDLLERLHVATFMIRLGHDKRFISHKLYGAAVQLTDSIGRQAAGWRKVTKNAAVPAA